MQAHGAALSVPAAHAALGLCLSGALGCQSVLQSPGLAFEPCPVCAAWPGLLQGPGPLLALGPAAAVPFPWSAGMERVGNNIPNNFTVGCCVFFNFTLVWGFFFFFESLSFAY